MNSAAFATHHRDRKVRCFASTLELVARPHRFSMNDLAEFVSGMTDEQWAQVTTITNQVHDCGIDHRLPSASTQREIVDHFTEKAIREEKVSDVLGREIQARVSRTGLRVLP